MLSSAKPITRYSCKYLDGSKNVYAIASRPLLKHHDYELKTLSLYTVPFHNKSKNETFNVLATFIHDDYAKSVSANLRKELQFECDTVEYTLTDISYYAHILNMPVIVIIDAWCDLSDREEWFDVFYTSKYVEKSHVAPF